MKWAVVVAIVVGLVIARRIYFQWKAGLQNAPADHPTVPAELLDGAERTWVVFTSPYCATCGPVKDHLVVADPNARVVTVDATRERHLADSFAIRSAPTALLADASGEVQARLVGAQAVRDYFAVA